jgi:two-component system sensor histidine kinase BaeS
MFRSIWLKFFAILLIVVAVALAAAFSLRQLMIRDFREYAEGQREDRVYWVIADLESSYGKDLQWSREAVVRDAVWALMMEFDVRLFDSRHNLVIDTDQALKTLSPLIQKRVIAISQLNLRKKTGPLFSYPLFLNRREIGSLEVRFLQPERESVFVRRSDLFLLFTVVVLGGTAFLLSILFSRRLTNPLRKLVVAAEDIIEGNLQSKVAASGRDEVARLAATFNRLTKFLETQEGLRKKLISNVAHEIRTPLTAMRGELAGMIDELIPNDKEQLKSLYEETWRLEGFLDGIEELSRAEAGVVFLQKRAGKLRPLFEDIQRTFDGVFLDKGVALKIQCGDELEVYADPDRLRQIIVNLLSNALKATQECGNVTMRAVKNGNSTCIDIEDTGCGIGKDSLPFIFERFYRSSEGGMGIGLTIVKELVYAHEGRIKVNSEEGKGTLFSICIPDREAVGGFTTSL